MIVNAIITLFLLSDPIVVPPIFTVDQLLCMATTYRQIEKTVMLLKPGTDLIYRIPCISPLQAEDLRWVPISSRYGRRLHPILNEYKHHSGVDFPGEIGENVYATADAVVIATGTTRTIGNYVKLQHAYGFTTIYGHLSEIKVSLRDSVCIGHIIGCVGSSGRSTGPHLHYGIKQYGKEQNPLPYCYLYLRWLEMLNSEGKK